MKIQLEPTNTYLLIRCIMTVDELRHSLLFAFLDSIGLFRE